jgi:acetyl esterase
MVSLDASEPHDERERATRGKSPTAVRVRRLAPGGRPFHTRFKEKLPATLDPRAADFLVALREQPTLTSYPLDEARRMGDGIATELSGTPELVASVGEISANGVRCVLYRPQDAGNGALVYLHGGGWALGSCVTHDGIARQLANRARCSVLLVDYRLAPEHPFPTPLVDCWTATEWAAERFERVAVGGDSAGGNLGAAVALRARDHGVQVALQLLIYPVTDCDLDTPSYRAYSEGYGLTREGMKQLWDWYVPEMRFRSDPEASPLRAPDIVGVAPALVVLAECDVLFSEGVAYADRLRGDGVQVTLEVYRGQIHGFYRLTGTELVDAARKAQTSSAAALREALG